jgi:transcriptional regulator with XRE-family HTH domain
MSDQNLGIGDRIAAARKKAGLSQGDFAPRAHVSLSLLRKVEQGQRAATPAMVAACAAALNIEVAQLTGQPYDQEGRQRDPVHALLPELRRALAYWDLPPHLDEPLRPWESLVAATHQAATMRRAGQHTTLAEALPRLLLETTAAAHANPATAAERYYELLVIQLFAAHSVTHKTGYSDLSTVVEDRITWAAERCSDPLMGALAAWARTTSMLSAGAYDIGLRLLDRVQDNQLRHGTDEALAMSGPLHLRSAILAARAQQADTARDHLAEATRIAGHLGGVDADGGWHQLSFGPANAAVHDVAVSVELGDGGAAVSRAKALHLPPDMPKIRAGHHFVDLARAQLWVGDRDGALSSLTTARQLVPQQTRHHPMTREVAGVLVRLHRRSNEPLTRFAGWLGLEP